MLDWLLPLTEGSSHPMLALGRPMAAAAHRATWTARAGGLAEMAGHPDPWLRAAERMLSGQLELNDGPHRPGGRPPGGGLGGVRARSATGWA